MDVFRIDALETAVRRRGDWHPIQDVERRRAAVDGRRPADAHENAAIGATFDGDSREPAGEDGLDRLTRILRDVLRRHDGA